MSAPTIDFDNVSKFYGEVLGVNRVTLSIPPGITGLVGPNGSGKTTLFNLATGLLRPTRGTVTVLGMTPDQPEQLFRVVGYSTQFDSFPRGMNGFRFVETFLRLHGHGAAESRRLAEEAIARAIGSRPFNGSSRSSTLGWWAIAWASRIRWRMPLL